MKRVPIRCLIDSLLRQTYIRFLLISFGCISISYIDVNFYKQTKNIFWQTLRKEVREKSWKRPPRNCSENKWFREKLHLRNTQRPTTSRTISDTFLVLPRISLYFHGSECKQPGNRAKSVRTTKFSNFITTAVELYTSFFFRGQRKG